VNHAGRRRGAIRRTAAAVAAATVAAIAFAATAAPADAGLMIDLRATAINGSPTPAGGMHDIDVHPGDVVSVQIVAVVSGTNNVNDEAFQAIHGSIRSGNGGLLVDMSQSAVVAPFNGAGSQGGSAVDSDGDGDLDIGSPPNGGVASTYFIPRAPTQWNKTAPPSRAPTQPARNSSSAR